MPKRLGMPVRKGAFGNLKSSQGTHFRTTKKKKEGPLSQNRQQLSLSLITGPIKKIKNRSQNTLLPSHRFLSSPSSSRLRSPFLLRIPSSPHRVKPQHQATARRPLRSPPESAAAVPNPSDPPSDPRVPAAEAAPLGLPRCIATSRSRRSST